MNLKNIVIIGSGNVATHFGKAFHELDLDIRQVYSPHIAHAERLAEQIGATATDDLYAIERDADLYLLSVKDDALPALATLLPATSGLWVHTTGCVSLDVLTAHHSSCGVIYPLQTLSRDRDVNFRTIPLYYEATDSESEIIIRELSNRLSQQTYPCNSLQRAYLHLSAAFACNFVNYLYDVAEQLLDLHNLPADALHPLIAETALKNQMLKAVDAQTGPAVRGDNATMRHHLELLKDYPDWQELYTRLSEGICQRKISHTHNQTLS